jgi:hypothetical protein
VSDVSSPDTAQVNIRKRDRQAQQAPPSDESGLSGSAQPELSGPRTLAGSRRVYVSQSKSDDAASALPGSPSISNALSHIETGCQRRLLRLPRRRYRGRGMAYPRAALASPHSLTTETWARWRIGGQVRTPLQRGGRARIWQHS